MKISKAIEELKRIQSKEGDIEVVVLHSLIESPDIHETTLENFEVKEHETIGKCVRLWL